MVLTATLSFLLVRRNVHGHTVAIYFYCASLASIPSQCLVLQRAKADFHIGRSLRLYSNPNNSLANGSCCVETCTACNTILNFCFRESHHDHEVTDFSTCFLQMERDTPSLFTFLAASTPPLGLNFTVSHEFKIDMSAYKQ